MIFLSRNYKKYENELIQNILKLETTRFQKTEDGISSNFSLDGLVKLGKQKAIITGDVERAISRLVGAIVCDTLNIPLFDKHVAISHWIVKIIEWRNKILNNVDLSDPDVNLVCNNIYTSLSALLLGNKYGKFPIRNLFEDFRQYEKTSHSHNAKHNDFIQHISNLTFGKEEEKIILEKTLYILKSLLLENNNGLINALKNVFGDWVFNNKYTKHINLTNVINKLKIRNG